MDQVVNLKHKTILLTTYSSGLRISETLNLRISDIDSKNMLLRVNHGKGNKDRLTVLSHDNLKILRLYWNLYRPTDLLFPGFVEGKPIVTRNVQHVFQVAKRKGRHYQTCHGPHASPLCRASDYGEYNTIIF
ncbi:tyrosine-type recombinase/integrase [Desulfosporosinus burensis]